MNAHAFMTELVAAHFGERPTLRAGTKVHIRFAGINAKPRLEPGVVIDPLYAIGMDIPEDYVVVRRTVDGKKFAVHPSSLLVVVCEAD